MDAERPGTGLAGASADDDLELWGAEQPGGERHSLVDLINRVLDRGVVISGDVTLSVAGVDLVYVGLNAVLTSVSTARRTLERRGAETPGGEAGAP